MKKINRNKRIRVFGRLFLGISWDFYKESRLSRKIGSNAARKKLSKRHRNRAIQLREKAIEMGGVLIKLGQFLSSRVDIMPPEYIEELAKLQDQVAGAPFLEVKKLIEAEFNKPLSEIFKSFNKKPEAAASLGQVHEAFLFDGTRVAVKVQRPGIDYLVQLDSAIFSYLMSGVNRFTSFGKNIDIKMMVEEFNRTLGEELDFFREGVNALEFKKNFKHSKEIYIPKVYFEYTTAKVLTLEHISGIKINDYKTLDIRGIDRKEIAKEVVNSYLKQVVEYGFFHADPHPGNLFVVEGPEITFVDFGMVGRITPKMKRNLTDMVIAIATKDIDGMVSAFINLGFLRKTTDLTPVKNAIGWMFDHYSNLSSKTLTFEDIEQIDEDLRRIMREQPFTIPAEYTFLGRAIGTLNGLATGLDPQFDVIKSIKPYVDKLLKDKSVNKTEIILNQATEIFKTLISLPKKADNVLNKLDNGRLTIKLESNDLVKAIELSGRKQRLNNLLIFSLSLLLGSFLLLSFKLNAQSYITFSFSILAFISSFFVSRKKKR